MQRINNAIAHWNTNTNWRLIARTTQTNYVQFRNGDVCSSPVGRQGGRQAINLANNCGFGAAVHEIGHALGFHNEQNRRDRNNNVIVMPDRVEPARVSNFTRVSASSYLDHGPYDYGSIMHYGRNGFLRRKRYDWSSKWSNVRPYSIAGETYLFMLKTNDGVVHGHRMDAALGVGREIQRFDWSSGWTTTETFTAGTSTYLFLLKQNGGAVHTHRLNNDGTVGSRVDRRDWSDGWTTAEFWRRGARTFLFLLKRSNGVVHRPSGEETSPVGPFHSLPGTSVHPSLGCHSQNSPTGRLKCVAAKPRPGSAVTELNMTPSGASAQPRQVSTGVPTRASTSKTSIASRAPRRTT